MSKILLLPLFLTSCVTAQLVSEQGDVKTIRVNSGRIGDSMYATYLQERAEKACPNGFKILEKTKKPSTLPEADPLDFYWVIKCSTSS